MFRSHGGTVPTLAGWNLSSEASSPSSAISCRRRLAGRGADTPAILTLRVGTVATGTAPAFGRTLAPRYGSDLLTLRLRSLLQRGDAVFRAAPLRRLTGFARPAHSPPSRLRCAPCPMRDRAFWQGWTPPGNATAFWSFAVATITLWVTTWACGSKPPAGLTRLGRGFSSRLTAQLLIRENRPDTTPTRGTGEICLPPNRLRGCGGEGGTSCHQPFPGRPGLSQPCSRRIVSDCRAATVLSRNEEDHVPRVANEKALYCTTSSPGNL
jgi:hypothetical protein